MGEQLLLEPLTQPDQAYSAHVLQVIREHADYLRQDSINVWCQEFSCVMHDVDYLPSGLGHFLNSFCALFIHCSSSYGES